MDGWASGKHVTDGGWTEMWPTDWPTCQDTTTVTFLTSTLNTDLYAELPLAADFNAGNRSKVICRHQSTHLTTTHARHALDRAVKHTIEHLLRPIQSCQAQYRAVNRSHAMLYIESTHTLCPTYSMFRKWGTLGFGHNLRKYTSILKKKIFTVRFIKKLPMYPL